MEGVPEPTLLSFLGSERFHWLQVEVIIQMELVQVLSVYQEVQHVVPLSAYLRMGQGKYSHIVNQNSWFSRSLKLKNLVGPDVIKLV